MVGLIDKVMNRYGSQIVLQREESRITFRGFLHHTASKDWHNMEKVFSPLGQIPRGQYAVLAPPTMQLQVGDILNCNGKSYALRRVETVLFRDTPIYCWGLCVERGSATKWPQ